LTDLSLAEQMFEASFAVSRIEEELYEKLEELGVPLDDISWDWYDYSIELKNVAPEYRLTPEVQKYIYDCGFMIAYVNHTDKWETHYRYNLKEPFKEVKGFRVSYGFKRGDGTNEIWVEEPAPGWPEEWVKTGYVKVAEDECQD